MLFPFDLFNLFFIIRNKTILLSAADHFVHDTDNLFGYAFFIIYDIACNMSQYLFQILIPDIYVIASHFIIITVYTGATITELMDTRPVFIVSLIIAASSYRMRKCSAALTAQDLSGHSIPVRVAPLHFTNAFSALDLLLNRIEYLSGYDRLMMLPDHHTIHLALVPLF